jgi:hypothetical protein
MAASTIVATALIQAGQSPGPGQAISQLLPTARHLRCGRSSEGRAESTSIEGSPERPQAKTCPSEGVTKRSPTCRSCRQALACDPLRPVPGSAHRVIPGTNPRRPRQAGDNDGATKPVVRIRSFSSCLSGRLSRAASFHPLLGHTVPNASDPYGSLLRRLPEHT